jgi:radical SAM superfamily enzyme YgiQ (UPF0313 family)
MVKIYLAETQKEGLLPGAPYALLYLSEWARRNADASVEIIRSPDCVKEYDCYVGISVTTPGYQKGLEFARALKRRSRSIKTIIGGYHTKGQGKFIIKHPEVDYVVEGEGEKALVDILDGRSDGVVMGKPMNSEDLDGISVEHLMGSDPVYFSMMRQFGRMNYISSRGCPNSCSFCASSGKVSAKSPDKVVQDLEAMAAHGYHEISIQDNYFCHSPERIRQICNILVSRGVSIDWDCQTRPESIQYPALVKLMADSGCSAAYIGTENFHPEVLRMMKKSPQPDDYISMTLNAVGNMIGAGIRPYLNIQLGVPDESEDIRLLNIRGLESAGRMAQKHGSEIILYPHLNVIYPGTHDFRSLVAGGVPEDVFEAFTEWEEDSGMKLKKLLFENHFIHGAGGIPLSVMDHGMLKEKRFRIDERKVREVNEYMDRIRAVDGVRVYC